MTNPSGTRYKPNVTFYVVWARETNAEHSIITSHRGVVYAHCCACVIIAILLEAAV